jgi:hypothetical protein
MKRFGKITELALIFFRKSGFAVTVEPASASADTTFQLPAAGGGTKALVTTDATQTLTNKTFDADGTGNSITNIENADIKVGAAIDATKIHDGSISNAEFGHLNGVASALLGKDDAGVFTSKTISGSANTLSNIGDASLSSGISATKLADGSVDNTEFQRLGTAGTSGAGNLLTTDGTQSVTNKTIDGDLNTVQDLALSSLKTEAGDAGKLLARDGSGAVISTASPEAALVEFNDQASDPTAPAGSGDVRLYAKDDKLYTRNSLGSIAEVGAGSGGINYIDNDDFEANTVSPWATYADAAGTSPVDGTGGAPSITFAATASSPLRGTYSALLTKDAANRQGQGVSVDFTIAAADKSRPLLITWEGEASANYTGSSGSEYMTMFVYDVTNATMLPVSGGSVAPGSSKGSGFFVATTSTSYRLIAHIAGTGTAAWTYKLDSVSVGPQSLGVGTANPTSQVRVTNFAGYGSTNTAIMQFSSSLATVGTAISYANSASLGASFTINQDGVYTVIASADFSSACEFGISLNSSQLTTQIGAITAADRLTIVHADTANRRMIAAWTGRCSVGDVLRIHSDATSAGSNAATANCTVTQDAITGASITAADRAVEQYASNSSTSDANDTTSFVYGPEGSLVPTIAASAVGTSRDKTVQFQNAMLATDSIIIEIQQGGVGSWVPLENVPFYSTYSRQGSTAYGIGWTYVNSTQIKVNFFQGGSVASGATYASAGAGYPTTGGDRWRVRKVSGGAMVGFPVGSANIVGRTDGNAPGSLQLGQSLSQTRLFASKTSVSNGNAANVTASPLTLTPGVWKMWGNVGIHGASGTVSSSLFYAGISLTSAQTPQSNLYGTQNSSGEIQTIDQTTGRSLAAGSDWVLSIPPSTVSVSANTNYYLSYRLDFGGGGTAEVWGQISAVRVG